MSTVTFTRGGISLGTSTGEVDIEGVNHAADTAVERRMTRIPNHVRYHMDAEVAGAMLDLLDAAGVREDCSVEQNLRAVQVWLFAKYSGGHFAAAVEYASATATVNTLRYTMDMTTSWLRGPDVLEWAGPTSVRTLVVTLAAMGYHRLAWAAWDAWHSDGLKTECHSYPWVLATIEDISPIQTSWTR